MANERFLLKIFKKIFVKSYKAYSLDIRYVTSSSGLQKKIVQIMPPGWKVGLSVLYL